MPSSRGSSWPRDWILVSWGSCIVGGFFTSDSQGKPINIPHTQIYGWGNRLQRVTRRSWICMSKGRQSQWPFHLCRKEWTQEAKFKFWLCFQPAVTLNKAFDLSGLLFPLLQSQKGLHALQFSHPNFLLTLDEGQSCQVAWRRWRGLRKVSCNNFYT